MELTFVQGTEPATVTSETAFVGVPGLPADCRLQATWTPHHVAVWSRDSVGEEVECGVCELQWGCAQWNRVTRRLISQAHGYFMSLQKQAREMEGVSDTVLLEYSQFYRSSLHECILGLTRRARELSSTHSLDHTSLPDTNDVTAELQSYSIMELIWHLCEILFLDLLPTGCLAQQLLDWVRWHRQRGDECLGAILAHPRPEEHPSYWTETLSLVLTGCAEEARDLLQHHSWSHSMPEMFDSMDDLLRKMPMIRSTAGVSRSELHRRWQEWRSECCRRRDSGVFATIPHLHMLARILCGEDSVFKEPDVVDCCVHWYELMAARLLFTSPLVISGDYDLVYAAEVCLGLYPHSQGSLTKILFAAIKNDVMDVVKLCSLSLGNWFFVAHLTNLLHHKKLLHLDSSDQLSEFFVREYASTLASHTSLWQVAMDYFSECPLQGRHYMATFLERVPLTTDWKAEKVLAVCSKYELKDEAQGVCRVLATRAYHNGRLGKALSWCLRAKDSAFAAYLAEKYFDHYQSLGEFMDLDLLDHLGASMLLNDKLTFLCKYREFHRLLGKREFVQAGDLLVRLLLSNTVPHRFWITLLMDALPLLEVRHELVFNVDQTHALQHCLQELTIGKPENSDEHDKLQLLRRSMIHNLSRAVLEEDP